MPRASYHDLNIGSASSISLEADADEVPCHAGLLADVPDLVQEGYLPFNLDKYDIP